MHRRQMTIFSLLLSFVSFALFAADDWPRWMGPKMDGVWRETDLVESFPDGGPPVVWRQEVGGGYAGPSVADGRVYLMDRVKDSGKGVEVENDLRKHGLIPGGERVLCLDATDGKVVWEHSYDRPYKIAYPTGPRCTPIVDGDRVYTLGAMGDLICLQAVNGKVVWQQLLTEVYEAKPPVWGYAAHPLIVGDDLFVTVGGKDSAVVCLDKLTGQERWKTGNVSDIGYAPLVMYEDQGVAQLIFWSHDGVESLDPATGKQHWSVVYPETKQQAQATTIVTPQFVGNQLLVSEYFAGTLLLEVQSNPPGVKELYRSTNDDPKHEKSLNALMTTPFIENGYVYGVTGEGVMRCFELTTNELKWSEVKPLGEKAAEFATCFIIKNGDRFILFNDQGELILANLTPEGYHEISRAKILEPSGAARGRSIVWSYPAFSNGCVFARNDKEIVCVSLKKS